MTLALLLKLVHIAAAVVAVGSNVTYAFWLGRAGLDRDRLVFTIEGVRRLDRTIANPAYIVVLLTGLGMVALGPHTLDAGWIRAALGLYVLVVIVGIALFAPAVRRQLAAAESDPSSPAYRASARRSNVLGVITLVIVASILVLMVTKPF
jgi:uncharacterized membrane protein